MRVTIHQPNYLPYPGFFNKVKNSDLLIIFDKSKFKKTDFQQKNKIRTAKRWLYLIIPIDKSFENKPLNEVEFLDQKFKHKHLAIIHQNYHKSLFYKNYKSDLEKIYNNPSNKLAEFNILIIKYLMKAIGLKTKVMLSSKMDVDFSLGGTDINLALLKAVGATEYLSGPTGKKYLDLKKFKKAKINVAFQKLAVKEYPQVFPGFIPNLSIIDLLFNLGEKTIKYI